MNAASHETMGAHKTPPRGWNHRGPTPEGLVPMPIQPSEAIIRLFHTKYEVKDAGHTTPCWLWTKKLDRDGYARFAGGEKRGYSRAHRFAYIVFREPVPKGLALDHLCRNRHCVNPDHLEAVTNRENLMRGETYAAQAVAKTHCKYGHPLSGENLYLARNGTRKCKACARSRKREFRAKCRAEGRRVT